MTSAGLIGIVGAGAWGTALAQTLRLAGRDVLVWAHGAATAQEINARHTNATFLPGVALDPQLRATSELADLATCACLLLVTPAQHVRGIARALAGHVARRIPVVICAKGIEQGSGLLMAQVLAEVWPQALPAVLSGPSFAADVARGLPTAVTIACAEPESGAALAQLVGHKLFRPYWTDDLTGVELGGSVKNVLAIAAGIVQGRGLGPSAHAALVTRGFSELVRLGVRLGARQETLMGLSGLGDLILTCGSPQSRNMALGIGLGQGRDLSDLVTGRRSVAEGMHTAPALAAMARAVGVEMPVSGAVDAIIAGRIKVGDAIDGLLSRPFRRETLADVSSL